MRQRGSCKGVFEYLISKYLCTGITKIQVVPLPNSDKLLGKFICISFTLASVTSWNAPISFGTLTRRMWHKDYPPTLPNIGACKSVRPSFPNHPNPTLGWAEMRSVRRLTFPVLVPPLSLPLRTLPMSPFPTSFRIAAAITCAVDQVYLHRRYKLL